MNGEQTTVATVQTIPQSKTAVQEILARAGTIQRVMSSVMKNGVHYGCIPGCGDRPSLLKPGAEVIMSTFSLAASPRVDASRTEECLTYRVMCDIVNQAGQLIGTGVGEASTDEEKYKWRDAVCEKEWEGTIETHRRVKFCRGKGGSSYERKQVRTNPPDLANTVLKMAKKRALVDGVLTATGCSDLFSQDLDDIADAYRKESERVGTERQSKSDQIMDKLKPTDKPKTEPEANPAPAPVTNAEVSAFFGA